MESASFRVQTQWHSRTILCLFFAALLYSLWTATVGWNTPIMQEHSFRQTQTAIATHYIAEGGPILKYETPLLGPPWALPFEFPVYQVVSALVHNFTGCSLESAGRFTAKLFFYLCLIPLYLLALFFGARGVATLVPLTLFLVSPLYLFWSRQFMIESTATFFGLLYLALGLHWNVNRRPAWFAGAIVAGIFAALVKSTSYACYALALGLLFSHRVLVKRQYDFRWLMEAAMLLFWPLAAGVAWAKYTDYLKQQNPLADFITSAALTQWNFGTLAQRLSKDFWYMIFRKTIHDSIGHRTGWMISVALALYWGRRAKVYWFLTFLFFAAPLMFTNLHIIHNYYANANGVFLVLAVASLSLGLLAAEKQWLRHAGLALFALTILFSVREFMRQPYYLQQTVNPAPVVMGERLQAVVGKEDVMIIYGWDWDSTLPYFARRRTIHGRNVNWESPELAKSLELVKAEGRKVSAVVFCSGTDENPALGKNAHVGALLFKDMCNVYAFRE